MIDVQLSSPPPPPPPSPSPPPPIPPLLVQTPTPSLLSTLLTIPVTSMDNTKNNLTEKILDSRNQLHHITENLDEDMGMNSISVSAPRYFFRKRRKGFIDDYVEDRRIKRIRQALVAKIFSDMKEETEDEEEQYICFQHPKTILN
ncbi:hypothetical protein OnM2_072068 [Erysiphe neolycopersici]|uniref:Uncharacterized protein n=1 Tax=Erysiphe neolycopersici TaxID=212602 RepID=A0A420HJQ7_9PEZI|nr:hypothetical protein OnM2_072068 [Erysiphe neolycopersici]